jgi:hypothetical protein
MKKLLMYVYSLVFQDLLERLFRLFDHDRDNLLIQEEWVEFLKARLT